MVSFLFIFFCLHTRASEKIVVDSGRITYQTVTIFEACDVPWHIYYQGYYFYTLICVLIFNFSIFFIISQSRLFTFNKIRFNISSINPHRNYLFTLIYHPVVQVSIWIPCIEVSMKNIPITKHSGI